VLPDLARHAQAALLVMQYLPPPADVLRRSLTAGGVFPQLAGHVATFMARTLFHTSLLAMDSAAWRCTFLPCLPQSTASARHFLD
jgi:5-methylthioribose kinase